MVSDDEPATELQSATALRNTLSKASAVPASLVLVLGEQNQVGRLWQIGHESVTVGRSSGCDICIDDRSVSGRHFQISPTDKCDFIIDLGSTNKTIVNDHELQPKSLHPLKNNDLIRMGNVIVKYLARGNIESLSVAESFNRSYLDGFFARSGGEEFVLMLATRKSSMLAVQLENLRKLIAQHRFEFNGISVPVTVSIGLAMKTKDDQQWQDVLELADKALYRSKRKGRNRVTLFPTNN